jgi:hypothetical protein
VRERGTCTIDDNNEISRTIYILTCFVLDNWFSLLEYYASKLLRQQMDFVKGPDRLNKLRVLISFHLKDVCLQIRGIVCIENTNLGQINMLKSATKK